MSDQKIDFDNYVDEYDGILEKQLSGFEKDISYFARYKIDIVRRLYPQSEKILDFGCGIGRSLPFFKEAFPKAKLYASDESRESLKVVKSSYPDVEQGGLDHFLGNGDLFDIIFVACVYHHIPVEQRAEVSRKLASLLSPTGKVIIFEHNRKNPYTRYSVKKCPFDADAILLDADELRKLFKVARCCQANFGYSLFFPEFLSYFRRFEPNLSWFPLGGQYFIAFEKTT